jgi:hypothetical protein
MRLAEKLDWKGLTLQRSVVPICIVAFNIKKLHVSIRNAFMCFVETAIIFPYTALTDWFYDQGAVCLLHGTDCTFNCNPV